LNKLPGRSFSGDKSGFFGYLGRQRYLQVVAYEFELSELAALGQ